MAPPHPVQPVNLAGQISVMTKHWNPEHVLTLNGHASLKIAKIQGGFIWHSHPNSDEVFSVVSGGPLVLELDREPRRFKSTAEGKDVEFDKVTLNVGDTFCVPRGMRHRPVAEAETGILMIEEVGTVNTGDEADGAGKDLTVQVNEGV